MTKEKYIKHILLKIPALVLEINLKSGFVAFCSIAGHVHQIEISIAKSKTNYTSQYNIYSFSCYYDDVENNTKLLRAFKYLKSFLKERVNK